MAPNSSGMVKVLSTTDRTVYEWNVFKSLSRSAHDFCALCVIPGLGFNAPCAALIQTLVHPKQPSLFGKPVGSLRDITTGKKSVPIKCFQEAE